MTLQPDNYREPQQDPQPLFVAEPPVRSKFSGNAGLSYATRRLLTMTVLMGLIGCIIYYTYNRVHKATPQDIPTIEAQAVSKQKPEQPGGIDIPHQDVQVYQELDKKADQTPQVEHLLPPPETPQTSIPAAVQNPVVIRGVAEPVSPSPSAKKIPQMESLLGSGPKIETTVTPLASAPSGAPAVVDVTPAPTPAPAPVPQAEVTKPVPAPPPVPKISSNVVPKITPPSTSTGKASAPVVGGPVIQLASVPEQAHAQQLMGELQDKYASTLGGAKLRVVQADLGAKGIYYRIQSQRLSKDSAEEICSALKKLKAGCIIVHP